ncbi:hypothetical protein DERF_009696 [Dermatophagoides farinae]|uniref:Uncharacterized protein n=1 Tax=Dermatophagoides farinae TaxID=6954 RepID=A0A922L494_DERFA|nr:hypothetical protein DERF_009696 [Dermatophagoides farinae]
MDCIVKLGLKFLGLDAVVKFPRKNPYTFLAGMAVLVVFLLCLRTFIKSNVKPLFWISIMAATGVTIYYGIEELKEFAEKKHIQESLQTLSNEPPPTATTATTTVEPQINQKECEEIFIRRTSKMIGKCCLDLNDCHCLNNDHNAQLLLRSCPKLQEKNIDIVCRFMGQQRTIRNDQQLLTRKIHVLNSSSSSSPSSQWQQSIMKNKINVITIFLLVIDFILFIITIETFFEWQKMDNDNGYNNLKQISSNNNLDEFNGNEMEKFTTKININQQQQQQITTNNKVDLMNPKTSTTTKIISDHDS